LSDEPITSLYCTAPKCGAPLDEARRRKSSDRLAAARRESVTAPPLSDVTRGMIARLRREKPAAGRVLAAEGEEILAVLVSTTIGDEERTSAAKAIFPWHQRALDLLTAKDR
jgi:hypothetical protein